MSKTNILQRGVRWLRARRIMAGANPGLYPHRQMQPHMTTSADDIPHHRAVLARSWLNPAQLHPAAALQCWRRLPRVRRAVRVLPTVHIGVYRWSYPTQQQAVRCGDQLGWRLASRQEGDPLRIDAYNSGLVVGKQEPIFTVESVKHE